MERMRRNVFAWGPGLLLTALVVTITPGATAAEVIHLKSGQIVKGEPIPELSSDTLLVVRDLATGNLRKFMWKVLEDKDRQRLRKAWHMEPPTLEPVLGHVLTIELDGGATMELRGLLLDLPGGTPTMLVLGQKHVLERERVRNVRREKMDPRDIWSPIQIVNDFTARLRGASLNEKGMPTPRAHLRIARLAELVGAYARARGHYRKAAQAKDFPQARFAEQKEAAMAGLQRSEAAVLSLRRVRMAIQLHSFRKAREQLALLKQQNPDPREAVAKKFQEAKDLLKRTRDAYFQGEARHDFPRILRELIASKTKEKGLTLADAAAWSRRELADAAFAALHELFARKDHVTLEETRALWDARKRTTWRTASYGGGTFVVEPPKRRPPRKRSKKKGGKGPALPKPPTRDQWWAAVDAKAKAMWLFAYFVENSGLFQVGESKWLDCVRCKGTGLESFRLQSGETVSFVCRRCAGSMRDKIVRWR